MTPHSKTIRCAYAAEGARTRPASDPVFTGERITGRQLSASLTDQILGFDTTRLFLTTVVHVVGRRQGPLGEFAPIVDEKWIGTMFEVANRIWSQACIELVPYFTGILVTTFTDLRLPASVQCLDPGDETLVEPYDITSPGVIIVNVYLVDDTVPFSGCGCPDTGRVFLPTTGPGAELIGNLFAHELGHVLLNPAGVDDSPNPDHLMCHRPDPEVADGTEDGLYLSDCLAARVRVQEDLFAFAGREAFRIPESRSSVG